MKVLQINAVYKILSTGSICFELHDFLTKNGHDCITIYGNRKGDYKDTQYCGSFFTQKLHALLTRITGKIGYFSKLQTNKVIKYIKNYNPDVVHIHNLHANFISIPKILNYLGRNKIATVVTLHDCFYYTGGCTHYTVNNCFKWQTECKKCKFNNLTWLFDRTEKMFKDKMKLFNAIDNLAIIGVSDWITEEAKKSPVFKNSKIIKRIYNGIDLNVFKPQKSNFKQDYKIEDKKIILGVASGWSDKKGLDVFFDLSNIIDDSMVIVLVGNIKDTYIPQKIINISATENIEKLVEIYNAADVFVQASREETFGKVVAEAIACGTPVLTNSSTANPELVNEKCGIVVENFTTENIYKGIKEICLNGKDCYFGNCINFANERFNTSKNFRSYLNLYEEMLKG